MNKVIIWGLRKDFHSHKFIQNAFYLNARRMGFDAIWIDDQVSNRSLVKRGDIVFAVDVASQHLPLVNGAKYVLHNITPENLNVTDYINIQVHTKNATGSSLNLPYVHWDENKRTLFQPWGVPTSPKMWMQPSKSRSSTEFWVGSIWNNDLNQGNSEFMSEYIKTLARKGINFQRRGTPSRLRRFGISESKAAQLVNKSAIGAAVVGNWQKENQYIPCRLFKNVAAGVIPSSNANYEELFEEGVGVFDSNPEFLIEKIKSVPPKRRIEIVEFAQERLLPYTFIAGMNRIFTFLL